MLCLMMLVSQAEKPALAKGSEERRSSLPTIGEFVRRVHPHGISVSKAIAYRQKDDASGNNNVGALLKMLNDQENEKPYWPNIVVTLGLIADPLVITELKEFIKRLEEKPKLDYFESRALSSAFWALGLAANEGRKTVPPSPPPFPIAPPAPPPPGFPIAPPAPPPTEDESPFEEASNFLIKKSQERREVIDNRQFGMAPLSPNHELRMALSPPNHETVVEDIDTPGDGLILGLAFSDTQEATQELEEIRKDVVGKDRDWLDRVIRAQKKIHDAGSLLCYREPESSECH